MTLGRDRQPILASMAALAGFLRTAARAPLVVVLVLGGLLTVVSVFPMLSRAVRDEVVLRWSRMLLGACGVRLRERPADGAGTLAAQTGGFMLLANHVSWLDVFLVMAIAPSQFVAKAEIARWPVLGTLVSRVGTLFIERGKRHAVHRLNRRIVEALDDGLRVAVFPEGTTSDGRQLLPFHGNLVEAALHARAPVIPVGLRYLDADQRPTDAPVFIGKMAFVTSLARILSAPMIIAEVHPLPPADGENRQRVAEHARRAIGERLSLPMDDRGPDVAGAVRGDRGGR